MGIKKRLVETTGKLFGPIASIKTGELCNAILKKVKKDYSTIEDGYTLKKGGRDGRKYVVLRFRAGVYGVAEVFNAVIRLLMECEKRDIVVVPEWTVHRVFDDPDVFGKTEYNLWERYFCLEESLEDILNKETYDEIIALPMDRTWIYNKDFFEKYNGDSSNIRMRCISGRKGDEYRRILQKIYCKHIEVNEAFREKIRNAIVDTFGDKPIDDILGVFMREGFSTAYKNNSDDYRKTILDKHPQVLGVDTTIEKVKDLYNKWGCKAIYVSTLYEDTIDHFQRVFGRDRVIAFQRKRLNSPQEGANEDKMVDFEKKIRSMSYNDIYFERYDGYFIDLYLISQCGSFCSAVAGGGVMVPIIKDGKFRHIEYLLGKDGRDML